MSRWLAPLCLLLITGCGSESAGEDNDGSGGAAGAGGSAGSGGSVPASVVNEQLSHASPAQDASFTSWTVTQYRTTQELFDLDVRALLFANGELWAGTASGAAKLRADGSGFDAVTLDGTGPVMDFTALGTVVVAARTDRLVLVKPSGNETWLVTSGTVAAVATHGADVVVGTDQGVAIASASGVTPIAALQGFPVRDLALVGDVLFAASPSGVRRFDFAQSKVLPTWNAPAQLPDDDVRALAVAAGQNRILAGTALGYAEITLDGSATQKVAGLGALATGDIRAIATDSETVLVGHGIGLSTVEPTRIRHLHGLRWLPAEPVSALAVGSDGTRFVGTNAGIARHSATQGTLADKAAALEATTDLYVRMGGFMADEVFYADPWDHSGPPVRSDNDNDGLWTEMQIGAWCLAYATTKDQAFYTKARKAMDVMLLQIDVPGATFEAQGKKRGFIARSLVRADEGAIFDQKKSEPNWHLQEYQGKTYYWKDDTSSDEYTGHFFGIPLFYDLCAQNESEKAELREHLDAVMSYLVDNDYRLIDLDGKPTSFGNWSGLANAVDGLGPCLSQHLPNCAASFGGEGWLNSIEILGFLLAAWHVTGNDRYYQEYLKLALEQRYGEMVTPKDTTLTLVSPKNANHSDHELAILAYFTLLRYEPDAARRATWAKALRDFYEWEKPERNALELGLMASAIDDVDAAAAAQTLREIPADRRGWRMDNTHRQDAKLSPFPDRFDDPQFESVFPYDELGELEWNGNLYAVAQGGDGRAVQGVWPFLLPYWSLRYFQALK